MDDRIAILMHFLFTNWKVLLLAIPLIWFGIFMASSIHNHQRAVDQCVVDQFEREDGVNRDDLYEYCRAKARSGAGR